jgi:hypothetical protein
MSYIQDKHAWYFLLYTHLLFLLFCRYHAVIRIATIMDSQKTTSVVEVKEESLFDSHIGSSHVIDNKAEQRLTRKLDSNSFQFVTSSVWLTF